MSLTVKSISLVRKTNISQAHAETFLLEALAVLTDDLPPSVDWRPIVASDAPAHSGAARINCSSWTSPTGLELQRTQVVHHTAVEDGVPAGEHVRTTFSVRGLPRDGLLEFRIDNTRLKGVSMELCVSPNHAQQLTDVFQRHFREEEVDVNGALTPQ